MKVERLKSLLVKGQSHKRSQRRFWKEKDFASEERLVLYKKTEKE